jgi:hypothetical protein
LLPAVEKQARYDNDPLAQHVRPRERVEAEHQRQENEDERIGLELHRAVGFSKMNGNARGSPATARRFEV